MTYCKKKKGHVLCCVRRAWIVLVEETCGLPYNVTRTPSEDDCSLLTTSRLGHDQRRTIFRFEPVVAAAVLA